MMPGSPIVMWVRYDEERTRQRSVNPDVRDRPMRRERRPDPIGVRMMRMPGEVLVDSVQQDTDRGLGKLREAIAALARRLPAGPFSTAPGER